MKLVLASKNAHKLVEMRDILSQLGVEVVLESEVGVDVDVEETGATFEENAFLKARAVMEASGLPAIADDSGLCVDALNGAPGVYSARYGGGWTTWAATGFCWRTCGGSWTGGAALSPPSAAAFPTGTGWRPGGSAPAPWPTPPRGRTASAMTPFSLSPP